MSTDFLEIAITIARFALIVAGVLAIVRLMRGPTLLDRWAAIDLLAVVVVGMIALTAIQSNQPALIDVALALGLVGFLGTVAFARFVEERNGRAGGR